MARERESELARERMRAGAERVLARVQARVWRGARVHVRVRRQRVLQELLGELLGPVRLRAGPWALVQARLQVAELEGEEARRSRHDHE